jgi:Protein of unknown function (DUF1761)
MHTASNFNYLAYFVSAIVYFVIGFAWYSNKKFAKIWSKEAGVKMGGKSMPIWPMVGQVISSLLYALGVYMVVMLSNSIDIKGATIACLSIIAFFVFPINSGNLFFTGKVKLFLLDAGYQAIGAIVMTLILTFWK